MFTRAIMLACSFCLGGTTLLGQAYGTYDLDRLVGKGAAPVEMDANEKMKALDQVLGDLASHALDYPVHFDHAGDQERAVKDVVKLGVWFDQFVDVPNPNPYFLKRAGMLNSMGHNLDIQGMAQKADSIFRKWLSIKPEDPSANQMYGAFLGGVGKAKEAIPYLEKAMSLGVPQAPYSLGIAYLTLGEKEKATQYLKAYLEKHPEDKKTRELYEAISSGRVGIRNVTK
jgi:tetratricopeptide (TPR) repeat protein